jgi:hypothetical protein
LQSPSDLDGTTQEVFPMQHAHKQPTLPFTRTMLAPVVALVIGAAGLAGAYVVIDDGGGTTDSDVVAIRGTPVAPSQTKDESAIAAAVGNPSQGGQGETKDESAIAAAIAPSPQESASDEADRAKRTDPHGPASALP